MSRAWTFQDSRQLKRLGESKTPWSVGWYDPEGCKRSKRIGSKSLAEKHRRKLEGELAAGIYQDTSKKQWADFLAEYESKIATRMEPHTRQETLCAIGHFQRLVKPKRIASMTTRSIDAYVAKRCLARTFLFS